MSESSYAKRANLSREDVAKAMGLKTSEVRTIENKLMEKIKRKIPDGLDWVNAITPQASYWDRMGF